MVSRLVFLSLRTWVFRVVALAATLSQTMSAFATADENAGILGGVSSQKLREGDISFSDIPAMIHFATNFVLGFAATAAVVAIIWGAVQMAYGAGAFGKDGKQKGKDAIQMGIVGFLVSVCAWLMVRLVVNNL